MTATLDDELANLRRANAELQRRLDQALAERDEALDQQTATTEVLQVINSSPGDPAPVFDAILENAHTLCGADRGALVTFDGEWFRAIATRGMPEHFAEFMRSGFPLFSGSPIELLVYGDPFLHIPDLAAFAAGSAPEVARAVSPALEIAGTRTILTVPLRKDGVLLGYIAAYRTEVRPFSDKQIALLQNFAAQAVIAIENARLITETREALEQQIATAEVFGVINSSPGDLAPVFEAMLERAVRLCEFDFSSLWTFDGREFHPVARHGVPERFWQYLQDHTPPAFAHALAGERLVHIPDIQRVSAFMETDFARGLLALGLEPPRSLLIVSLCRDDALLGVIVAYRREVRPFTDKQIALLQNFAAQAVIAMENARLINETREALEQQTATAEVLQVINSSPGDLAPVFDAILEKAHSLCGAPCGSLQIYDGECFRAVADRGLAEPFALILRHGYRPNANTLGPQQFDTVQFDMTEAARAAPDNLMLRSGVEDAGLRTVLAVPLRKDDETYLGRIVAGRRELQPFTDKQIALLQNFASQAVIAMENARLITETREALEQQTATAEVLGVINSSPGNLVPVFDAMLDKATLLSEAAFGILWTYDGELFRAMAFRNVPPAFAEFLREPQNANPVTALGRIARGEPLAHIPDIAADEYYRLGGALAQQGLALAGFRTMLAVPMRRQGVLLGAFTIYRQEVRPFSEKQVALLQNFAAQAVIAMENARLITETQEALDQQTATAEVLQIINSSPGNLAPVFDAMLVKAIHLCETSFGILWTYDSEQFSPVVVHGPAPFVEFYRDQRRLPPVTGSGLARHVSGEDLIQIADIANDALYKDGNPRRRAYVELGGARTAISVALRKDGTLLGAIQVYRQEVRPFSDKQIALLQNFAAQAVIAMENARLITETREALEQQTATAEVLQVINSSPGNLVPVFEAILKKAHTLCGAPYGGLLVFEGEEYRVAAVHGNNPLTEYWTQLGRVRLRATENTPVPRLMRGERFVHLPDARADDGYRDSDRYRQLIDLAGARTLLAVPLRKDDVLLGVITAFRQEVRPFSDKQIALLETFADQAVIAMENARLLAEIRQRQAELRVTFDNMADGVAMFDEDLRLTAWNRNFQELLELPDVVLAERPRYADYLRILADRGEFGTEDIEGELSRRLEHTDQELRLERTRPDGRVIEVRRNAVQDGGFVLIYSDITERKRSEAEIRAARDAAEAAYRDLKAAQANLIQAEKMASLGQLTAGIAHEIKNPLNFVNNFADLSVELLDELKETAAPAITALGDEKRAEIGETIEMLTGNLEKIAEHGRRADGIVKSMLEHSRGSSGERRIVDLNGLIEEALNLAYHGARAQDASFNITLERDFSDAITPIELVPQDITRVCLNLIGNGFYAATKRQREGSDPKFKPTLKVSTRDLGDAVEIRVRDNGTGIAPEIKDKLFQPFFTTKPTGEGTGLGLSISYDIVTQEHGGTITVDSKVGEFTEFTVRLPRAYGATMAEAAS